MDIFFLGRIFILVFENSILVLFENYFFFICSVNGLVGILFLVLEWICDLGLVN